MKIHLEGMGLLGCLLAPWLKLHGHAVTWHDVDALHTAWRASTGAIFPCGGGDGDAYAQWVSWWGIGFPYPRAHFEEAAYWFNHRHPPHDGKYPMTGDPAKGLRRPASPFTTSLHLNAQTFVPAVRQLFRRGQRRAAPPKHAVHAYVVAHGFGARLHRCLWGWTVPVRLKYDRQRYDQRQHQGRSLRPAFYFREGRFVMAYAYPIPGTREWYAGSSLIPQQPGKLRELEVMPKFLKWAAHFEDLSGGEVEVLKGRTDAALQGWRPAATPAGAVAEQDVQRRGNVLTLPPLWHNGIRAFPLVLAGVLRRLEEL